MNGIKLALLSPLRFIQTCMEWQKCTFSTDSLHSNPSPADDPRFSRVLLQPNDKICTNGNLGSLAATKRVLHYWGSRAKVVKCGVQDAAP